MPAASLRSSRWVIIRSTTPLDGVASEPQGEALLRYRDIYLSVWPDGRERLEWQGLTHLVITPHWIRFSDFDQSPPAIAELHLPLEK
jgi:hypothetical protein